MRVASCCGNCRSGKPCCGKSRGAHVRLPRFQRQNGLWLPRRDLFQPRSMLQYPREQEWSGGLVRPWLPALVKRFDMSCLPCCQEACCPNVPATLTVTFVSDCACFNYTHDITFDTDQWISDSYDDPCSATDNTQLSMWCDPVSPRLGGMINTYYFSKLDSAECGISPIAMTLNSCEPFNATVTATIQEPCSDCDGETVDIDVSE